MKLSTRALGALALAAVCAALSTVAGAVAGYTTVTKYRITNSTIDSTVIGATTPSAATFTGIANGGNYSSSGQIAISGGITTYGIVNNNALQTIGIQNNGSYTSAYSVTAPNFIGNASTASALQANPSTCGGFALGILAAGTAVCGNAANNFNQSGYQYLPGGLILEWVKGVNAVNGRGQTSENLPLTFPHGCIGASVSVEFTSYVSTTNYQGAAFYLQPNGCGNTSVSMQYDVRADGHADSSYVPRIVAIGW